MDPKSSPDKSVTIGALRDFVADGDDELAIQLGEDTNLFELKTFDSIKIVSLVLFVEEKFDLMFDYEDLSEENLVSLRAIAELISRKQCG